MNETLLASVAGIILSLVFSYAPGVREWYEPQTSQAKSLIMLGLLALVAVGAFSLSCTGWWVFVTCDQAGIKQLIEAFIAALVSNQATYLISPTPKPQ